MYKHIQAKLLFEKVRHKLYQIFTKNTSDMNVTNPSKSISQINNFLSNIMSGQTDLYDGRILIGEY